MVSSFKDYLIPFSKKLFLSVISLFAAFVICFLAYQYNREKEYKIHLLETRLDSFNHRLHDHLTATGHFDSESLQQYIHRLSPDSLRVTLIRTDGTVLFDNVEADVTRFTNHLSRPEVQRAHTHGTGYAVIRESETLQGNYFYSACYFPAEGYYIRSALPYDVRLMQSLKADSQYLWFTLVISLLLIYVFYRYTRKLGTSITQLQQFAKRADRNQPVDLKMGESFPDNELGDISRHIIQIYKRLHRVKEDLYIEREKLITHLQISHEGLGVFTHEKKEILVNDLFTQYANYISDENLSATEAFFSIPEMQPITTFIGKNASAPDAGEERRMSFHIDKNGRIFSIECILFQDDSFEISINDVTQLEEQARIKKQLTQNIAHELKTPVSSIQGYLETMVNNPDIPREKQKEFLLRSYAQSNRLAHLLRDISLLTRMEEAPELIDKERVNVYTMIQAIFTEVALDLEKRHIEAQNLIAQELTVTGNSSLLYSIFRNLTDNAIAYAGTDIRITIRCFRDDERFYYFSFSDNGVGVAPEHLNLLFERFYRIDKGRSRKMGGTGLGLAIVKNAVLLHGGSIFAKSNPGGGLEFIFTLSKN